MKLAVNETCTLVSDINQKVVLRRHSSGLVSVEFDLATLKDIGINIDHKFHRPRKKSYIKIVGTNFQWNEKNQNEL